MRRQHSVYVQKQQCQATRVVIIVQKEIEKTCSNQETASPGRFAIDAEFYGTNCLAVLEKHSACESSMASSSDMRFLATFRVKSSALSCFGVFTYKKTLQKIRIFYVETSNRTNNCDSCSTSNLYARYFSRITSTLGRQYTAYR